MDAIQKILNSVCKPLIVYNIFVIALILYDITQADFNSVIKNSIFLVVGSALIWLLCFLGFGPAAWILLSLPVFFVVALIASVVVTQIIKTILKDEDGDTNINGKKFLEMIGIKDQEQLDKERGITHDYSDGVNAPSTPYVDPACKKPEPPKPPKITPKERVATSLLAIIPEPPACNSCNTCNSCDTGCN